MNFKGDSQVENRLTVVQIQATTSPAKAQRRKELLPGFAPLAGETSVVVINGALARPLGRAHWFSGVQGKALPDGRANAPLIH